TGEAEIAVARIALLARTDRIGGDPQDGDALAIKLKQIREVALELLEHAALLGAGDRGIPFALALQQREADDAAIALVDDVYGYEIGIVEPGGRHRLAEREGLGIVLEKGDRLFVRLLGARIFLGQERIAEEDIDFAAAVDRLDERHQQSGLARRADAEDHDRMAARALEMIGKGPQPAAELRLLDQTGIGLGLVILDRFD